MKTVWIAAAAAGALLAAPALAQQEADARIAEAAPGGRMEQVTVHSDAVAGNLEGNSADRTVLVYLPAGYDAEPGRRYPVLYSLHGYSLTAQAWADYVFAPGALDSAMAGGVKQMIVVFPDSMTVHGGAMYSSSVTTGDFIDFIAEDLVDYIDANYRTLAQRESRGLMGHSMGGYGVWRIAMEHPEQYDSIYAMSSCCLSARRISPMDAALEDIATVEEAQALGMGGRTTFAASAAWSPNPDNPPFYLNLPTHNGEPRPDVLADWAAGAPNALLAQHVGELKSFDAVALDVGTEDGLLGDNATLDELLTRFGVEHSYETYEGDHVNRIAERFVGEVLPFFSEHLTFEQD